MVQAGLAGAGLPLSSTQVSEPCPVLAHSVQLTETSSRYARKISGTTALQEALKEKQQHIEQLLAERDLERAEVAKATSHICEVEKEIALLKAQHEQVGATGAPSPASLLVWLGHGGWGRTIMMFVSCTCSPPMKREPKGLCPFPSRLFSLCAWKGTWASRIGLLMCALCFILLTLGQAFSKSYWLH